jgi:hypothetical protein
MTRILIWTFFLVLPLSALPGTANADTGPQPGVTLGTDSSLQFASRQTASAILSAEDAYTARLSPFDRMLRLKSSVPVSTAEYFAHMAANGLEWTSADITKLTPVMQKLSVALADYRLPLPPTVLLVKTTGKEEVGAGHTRANAIVLPVHSLAEDDDTLFFLLAHELFHVMTRHDPHFRSAAYAQVGFRQGQEVRLPAAIAPLQITNPDVPRHDSFITVRTGGQAVEATPVLLSRSAVLDPEIGDELDDYWTLRLLVVERTSPSGTLVPRMRNGAPVLLRLRDTTGYFDQIGRNTSYVIHAEEVLAENFAFMVTGETVSEPQRVEALRELLIDPGRAPVLPEAAIPQRPAPVASQPDRLLQSRSCAYLSANSAGWPPVCQNSTVSLLEKYSLRTRSINPAAARPEYTGSSSKPSLRANSRIASRSESVTTPYPAWQ